MSCNVEYWTMNGKENCIRPSGHKGGHSAFTIVVSDETPKSAHELDCCRRIADHLREAITLALLLPHDNTEALIFLGDLKSMVKRAEELVKL